MRRSPPGWIAVAGAAVLCAGCATTVRDTERVEPTWRSARAAEAPSAASGERLTVYVASFGLSEAVAERHPELTEARAGWGLAQRIADALYESQRFRFLEEKAELAERLADLRTRTGDPAVPAEAHWLLYGELVDVEMEREERVTGFAGRSETITRATVQIRLVDRSDGRYWPATGTGSSAPSRTDRDGAGLDADSLAAATGEAVRAAAAALVGRLEEG